MEPEDGKGKRAGRRYPLGKREGRGRRSVERRTLREDGGGPHRGAKEGRDKSKEKETRADKRGHEDTRADKSRQERWQELARASKNRQEQASITGADTR